MMVSWRFFCAGAVCRACACMAVAGLFVLQPYALHMQNNVWASSYSPPRTGLEPPGGPRKTEVLPGGRSIGRTAEGGMGYTDAYGNTITNRPLEETKAHPRLRPGAYGAAYGKTQPERPLPDPQDTTPAWNFK